MYNMCYDKSREYLHNTILFKAFVFMCAVSSILDIFRILVVKKEIT